MDEDKLGPGRPSLRSLLSPSSPRHPPTYQQMPQNNHRGLSTVTLVWIVTSLPLFHLNRRLRLSTIPYVLSSQSRAVLITCRCGFLGIALDALGERREIKVLLELELVIEYFADRCRDVVLVLVEESLQVDRAKIGAPLLEVI